MLGEFKYVDYWDKHAQKKWVRAQLPVIVEREVALAKKPDIFVTVQMFKANHSSDTEEHICPLFFDFDSEAGLDGPLEDAQAVFNELTVEMGIDPTHINVKLSGRKGFHLIVNPSVIGCRPSVNATSAVGAAAREMIKKLEIKDAKEGGSFDAKVYSKRRMLRIPNSLRKDGTAAVALDPLKFSEMSLADVLAVAEAPEKATLRSLDWPVVEMAMDAAMWFSTHMDAAEIDEAMSGSKQSGFIRKPTSSSDMPACIRGMLEPKLRSEGSRNHTTFLLGIGLREMEWELTEAEEVLLDWTKGVHRDATGGEAPEHILANATGTVRSAYRGERRPSCRAMKALGTDKAPLPCDGAKCTWVNFIEETPEEYQPEVISLEQATHHSRVNKRARVECSITRQDLAPHVVPGEVELSCDMSCDDCPRRPPALIDLRAKPDAILEYIFSGSAWQGMKGIRRVAMAIAKMPPKCKAVRCRETKAHTMLNVAVQPILEGMSDDRKAGGHRENEAWLPIKSVEAQAHYRLNVIPVGNPKTMMHTLFATKVEKISKRHDNFEVTKDVYKRLSSFQCGGSAKEVLEALTRRHTDYQRLHGILGRVLESIAMSLVWHSVLGFRFRGREVRRGWLECLAVGDTAQGKTELARSLLEFYGVGDFLPGENVTTAGLTAGVEQIGRRNAQRPGALVRADTGLVILDEVHEMPESVMRSLSEVRSSGIVRMEKIASATALARVRKVMIGNPLDTHSDQSVAMDKLHFGCQAVMNIMRTPEDVRRLDFAIGFKRKPEITSLMNNQVQTGDVTGQADASDLVLWAWSRTSSQVQFSRACEDKILELGSYLAGRYDCSIPLIDAGEAKIKIARMACAIAASVFSTTDGEVLLVEVCHAETAVAILEKLYQSKDLGLYAFACTQIAREGLTEAEAEAITNKLHASGSMGPTASWIEVLDLFDNADQAGWSTVDLTTTTSMGQIAAVSFMKIMTHERCLKRAKGMGFMLTDRGRKLCKEVNTWKHSEAGILGHISGESEFGGVPDDDS